VVDAGAALKALRLAIVVKLSSLVCTAQRRGGEREKERERERRWARDSKCNCPPPRSPRALLAPPSERIAIDARKNSELVRRRAPGSLELSVDRLCAHRADPRAMRALLPSLRGCLFPRVVLKSGSPFFVSNEAAAEEKVPGGRARRGGI
jgi:hypothetical protein